MREFFVFSRHFLIMLHHVRGVLIALTAALVLCAVATARVEDIDFGDAVYFTLITGLTVGYGDITPVSSAGRVLSVVGGVIGVIFAGIIVAVATRALTRSVQEGDATRSEED